MSSKYFKIAFGILIITIIASIVIVKLFERPFSNLERKSPDFTTSATIISTAFELDENAANSKYVDQILQIKGRISDLTITDGSSVIILTDETGKSSINCKMRPLDNLNSLKLEKGTEITIKGVCTGYLLDVIMVNCVIVNESSYEN